MRSLLALVVVVIALLLNASNASADVNGPIFFSQPGNVTLTLDYSTGGFDHILELADALGPLGIPLMALTDVGSDPSADVLGYPPAALGDSVSLGFFAASQELIFRLTNVESERLGTPGVLADQLFTGSASSQNPSPSDFYTLIEFVDPYTIRVYWEDLSPVAADDPDPASYFLNGGYDVAFTLTLVPIPEPGTLALLILGLAAIGARNIRRR